MGKRKNPKRKEFSEEKTVPENAAVISCIFFLLIGLLIGGLGGMQLGKESPTIKEPEIGTSEETGKLVCATVDSEFLFFTNGGGIRCKKYVGNVLVEYIFQPLEYWQGAYVFDTIFVGLPNSCHIPSGEC